MVHQLRGSAHRALSLGAADRSTSLRQVRMVVSRSDLSIAKTCPSELEGLVRAFFSARFVRVLVSLGYARFRRWRIYGEEGLVGGEAALWPAAEFLTVEHAGRPLSRYETKVKAGTGRLRAAPSFSRRRTDTIRGSSGSSRSPLG